MFATAFAVFGVVLPSLVIPYDKYVKPISIIGGRLDWVAKVFNISLIGSGLSQFLFAYYISTEYDLGFPNIGAIVFMSGTVFVILMAFVTYTSNYPLHQKFAFLYFALTTISGFIFSFQLRDVGYEYWELSLVLSAIAFGSALIFFQIMKIKSYSEYASILFKTLWVLHFYVL